MEVVEVITLRRRLEETTKSSLSKQQSLEQLRQRALDDKRAIEQLLIMKNLRGSRLL